MSFLRHSESRWVERKFFLHRNPLIRSYLKVEEGSMELSRGPFCGGRWKRLRLKTFPQPKHGCTPITFHVPAKTICFHDKIKSSTNWRKKLVVPVCLSTLILNLERRRRKVHARIDFPAFPQRFGDSSTWCPPCDFSDFALALLIFITLWTVCGSSKRVSIKSMHPRYIPSIN